MFSYTRELVFDIDTEFALGKVFEYARPRPRQCILARYLLMVFALEGDSTMMSDFSIQP